MYQVIARKYRPKTFDDLIGQEHVQKTLTNAIESNRLAHGYIYRWPATRLTDSGIDAALTRFAWPGYRLVRRWLGRETGPPPSEH